MRIWEISRMLNTEYAELSDWPRHVQWTVNQLRIDWALAGGGEAGLRVSVDYLYDGREKWLTFTLGTPRKAPMIGGAYGRD